MKSFNQHLNEDCGCSHSKVPDSEDIEMDLVRDVKNAHEQDREELKGPEGERKHENLHKTIARFIQKMKAMHEGNTPKDGEEHDERGPEEPMSDDELKQYYKDWKARKKN
jgi:hypothetical protein